MKFKHLLFAVLLLTLTLTSPKPTLAQEYGTFNCTCTTPNSFGGCDVWDYTSEDCTIDGEVNLNVCDAACDANTFCFGPDNLDTPAACSQKGSVTIIPWGDECLPADTSQQCTQDTDPPTSCQGEVGGVHHCYKPLYSVSLGGACEFRTECEQTSGFGEIVCNGGVCAPLENVCERGVCDLCSTSLASCSSGLACGTSNLDSHNYCLLSGSVVNGSLCYANSECVSGYCDSGICREPPTSGTIYSYTCEWNESFKYCRVNAPETSCPSDSAFTLTWCESLETQESCEATVARSCNSPPTIGGSLLEACGFPTAVGCLPILVIGDLSQDITTIGASIAGGIALILIIIASYQMMTSQGDPRRLQGSKELLLAAIGGIILLVFGALILKVVGVNILQILPQ